jgi:hypothetical protein
MSDPGKDEPSTLTVKRTILFRPEDWERIEEAARRLTQEIHVEVSEPEFIRGAVARRCDEILRPAEPAEAA